MQASKEAQIEEAARLELFDRQNVAGASDHTSDQIKELAKQSHEDLRAPTNGHVSGFSVKVNEKRAKETKACFPRFRLHQAPSSVSDCCMKIIQLPSWTRSALLESSGAGLYGKLCVAHETHLHLKVHVCSLFGSHNTLRALM